MDVIGSGPRKDSLIEFPCHFPIKVMGKSVPEFAQVIADLLGAMNPGFDPGSIEMRPSSKGTYISLTCTVRVSSQDELDAIYRALTGHELVSIVL
ncbi:MAG: DUF493 family protein [Limnobacter sp.]|uniref:HP0495 family protein n=1 Tax=Limnobacter sp. TaxID=2003368 RepID=UPI00391A871B